MTVVIHGVVALRLMALCAEQVAFGLETKAVGVMAVGTGNSGLVHATLDERTMDIYLVLDLTIGVIEGLVQ
jgi:hypothetical protein